MTKDELRKKANELPLLPGVYLMMDKSGQVIYVGKAKKLKNRVSQYFQDTASHTPKTRLMVSKTTILTSLSLLPNLKRWCWNAPSSSATCRNTTSF